MSLNYGWEKFFTAINSAITHEGTLQQRLESAYAHHLFSLDADDVPPEVWDEFKKLQHAVTSKPAVGKEGSLGASTSAMDDDEAKKWLLKVVSMFSDVASAYGREP